VGNLLRVALGLAIAMTAARAEVLCCGRWGAPVAARPAVALESRESPWSGDVVLALDGRSGALEAALAQQAPAFPRGGTAPHAVIDVVRDRVAEARLLDRAP
jgi:hypothetical protein